VYSQVLKGAEYLTIAAELEVHAGEMRSSRSTTTPTTSSPPSGGSLWRSAGRRGGEMFEQSLQTTEWRDAQEREGRSEEEIRARRIAAVLIAVNAVIGFAFNVLLTGGHTVPLLPLGVGLALAWYLYKLCPRAESFAIGLAILWSTLLPLLYLLRLPFVYALVQSVVIWGLAGALLLLLIGQPSRRRQALAVGLFALAFGVFVLGAVRLLWWR
jgi:hypothetical protein